MKAVKGPHIPILHTISAVHEVQSRALAQSSAQNTFSIETLPPWIAIKESLAVFRSDHGEARENRVVDPQVTALRDLVWVEHRSFRSGSFHAA